MAVAVEMLNISKFYPGVVASDNVSLSVNEGEILGLIGENGAGKSTMMNMLYGMTEPDLGEIRLFGNQVRIQSPDTAIKHGIGMVHQHFMLMPNLSVLQNIILGKTPTKSGLIDIRKAKAQIEEIMETYNLPVDLDMKIYQLSVGEKQRVEIIKALYREAKILIMDEPTVAVDPQSRNKILEGIEKLNKDGATIIYTSHYMEEVEQICSRIVIMDKGKKLAIGTKDELKKMIKNTETVVIEMQSISEEHIKNIEKIIHVYEVSFEDGKLIVKCSGGKHNLIRILDYINENEIPCGRIYSERPTLNDVFLEITGKELRDKEA